VAAQGHDESEAIQSFQAGEGAAGVDRNRAQRPLSRDESEAEPAGEAAHEPGQCTEQLVEQTDEADDVVER